MKKVNILSITSDNRGSKKYLMSVKDKYFVASLIESFGGVANHTTPLSNMSLINFNVTESFTKEFESIIQYLESYL